MWHWPVGQTHFGCRGLNKCSGSMSFRKQRQGTQMRSPPIALDGQVGGSGGVGTEHTIRDTGIVADFYLFKERGC